MDKALPKRAPHGHDRHIRSRGDHVTKTHLGNAMRHLASQAGEANDMTEVVPGGGAEEEE